jgi:hypothetical protein
LGLDPPVPQQVLLLDCLELLAKLFDLLPYRLHLRPLRERR